MKTVVCCEGCMAGSGMQGVKRSSSVSRWSRFLICGLTLVLMPKCPICLAAWITVITGVSLSPGVAEGVRTGLMLLLSLGLLSILMRWLRQWNQGWRARE